MYSKIKLHFTALNYEFKACKARNLMTFQNSEDPCIKEAEIEVDAGKKANTLDEVNETKYRLKLLSAVNSKRL